jgi:thymidylate synthase (FAD)
MKIDVLDKGYVRLVDTMGSDLSIVNAARVSYDKEVNTLEANDHRLIEFLWKHGHTSPFRHAALTFEVYAPLMVARQWYKHAVSSTHLDDQSGWNESSRRYITEDEQFYFPSSWRSKPADSKQGSGAPMGVVEQSLLNIMLSAQYDDSLDRYEYALDMGVAPEQARLFLPANALYVRWRWTTSLHSAIHFIDLRVEHTSQWEIQQYAEAVESIVRAKFPVTMEAVSNGV